MTEGPQGIPTPEPLDPDHSFAECEGCETHTGDWWEMWEAFEAEMAEQ